MKFTITSDICPMFINFLIINLCSILKNSRRHFLVGDLVKAEFFKIERDGFRHELNVDCTLDHFCRHLWSTFKDFCGNFNCRVRTYIFCDDFCKISSKWRVNTFFGSSAAIQSVVLDFLYVSSFFFVLTLQNHIKNEGAKLTVGTFPSSEAAL